MSTLATLLVGYLATGSVTFNGARPAVARLQSEYEVKAAFLFNFTKFIEWPASRLGRGESIVIGIVGQDPFGKVIDDIVQGKSVNGHSLVVKRLKWSDDLGICHMLFVPEGEQESGRLEKLASRSVVVIGETPGFTRKGGIINFVIESGRVRFEINGNTAKASGVTISSKLLSLAKK